MQLTIRSALTAGALSALCSAQTASFTYQELAQYVYQFTDTSASGATAWDWDFDDDGVVDASGPSPVWAFPGAGVYPVTLTTTFGTTTASATETVFVEFIQMPPFTNTYTSASQTRGYWFPAPLRFSIVGLSVPDESAHGLQNVAVYRLDAPPPIFTASTTGGLEFFAAGVPTGTQIPCSISFDAGEVVGILGACGDQATMRNSYGASISADILGVPALVKRFITQTNIVTTSGAGAYSQTTGGSIARVFAQVTPCVGLAYGDGTPSSQAPAPTLRTTTLPFLGQSGELTLDNQDAGVVGILAVGLGRANAPSPIGNVLIGSVEGSVALNGGAPMNPGSYTFQWPIPANSALNGFGPVNWQAATLNPSTGEVALSNGNEWWLSL